MNPTRRSWLRATVQGVGAIGAVGLGWPGGQRAAAAQTAAGGKRSTKRWKTAIGLNGFMSGVGKYRKNYPIWEILDFAARTGFDGVELVQGWPAGPYPDPDETRRVAALKGLYDRYGLQIFAIQAAPPGQAHHADAAVRRRWLDGSTKQARLAKALGCELIGNWPGGPLGDQSFERAMDHLIGSYKQATKVAADLGLIAVVEIEPPFIFNRPEHMIRILDGVDHPAFKAIYDPSHFDLMTGSKGRPEELLERIGVKRFAHVHLTDTDGTLRDGGTSKHLPCGDGHVDIRKSLQVLWEGGYRGWLMIDAWEVPDAYEACRKGKQAIDSAVKAFTSGLRR